jgi:hypothetical protein
MHNQRTKWKYKGKREVFNEQTGESLMATEFAPYLQDIFYKVFQNGRGRMFPKGMSGATHEVIQFLILEMRKDNLVFFDPEQIKSVLGVSLANCKKIKATLIAKDVMRPRAKGGSAYIVNPMYGGVTTGDERAIIYQEYLMLPAPLGESPNEP